MTFVHSSLTPIAIFGKLHQEAHFEELAEFFSLLSKSGFKAAIAPRFYNYLIDKGIPLPDNCYSSDTVPEDTQTLISIGGDGTFLKAAQWLHGREVPILGINTGTLGFLANYSLKDASVLLDGICKGKVKIEPRTVLKIEGDKLPKHIFPYALNEVAILKDETSSMITVHTLIDGFFLADYRADGLVISTPTGSTAYNLSVGGPIVQPTLNCRIISPVAPHSLTMRPLVVDATSPIEAVTTSRAFNYRLSLDGRSFVMRCGTSIIIRTAPFKTAVLHLPDYNFASTLRQKLFWAQH